MILVCQQVPGVSPYCPTASPEGVFSSTKGKVLFLSYEVRQLYQHSCAITSYLCDIVVLHTSVQSSYFGSLVLLQVLDGTLPPLVRELLQWHLALNLTLKVQEGNAITTLGKRRNGRAICACDTLPAWIMISIFGFQIVSPTAQNYLRIQPLRTKTYPMKHVASLEKSLGVQIWCQLGRTF